MKSNHISLSSVKPTPLPLLGLGVLLLFLDHKYLAGRSTLEALAAFENKFSAAWDFFNNAVTWDCYTRKWCWQQLNPNSAKDPLAELSGEDRRWAEKNAQFLANEWERLLSGFVPDEQPAVKMWVELAILEEGN